MEGSSQRRAKGNISMTIVLAGSVAVQIGDAVAAMAPAYDCAAGVAPLASPVLALSWPGGWEWILIAIVALVLFGKRLPDVARSFGKSIVEFKKGIRDVQDEVEHSSTHSSASGSEPKETIEKSAK
jgi:sec-independent protein translocase protein TatA